MHRSPIFIHSLFRSGSTYFFNVFRRSPSGYCCFQEALHPAVYFNRNSPQNLLKLHTSIYELLRHPDLEKPYFYELVSIPPTWSEKITYSALFDGYFGSDEADNGVEFFKAILDEVKDRRAVFEECRTAGRIRLFKKELGGVHIYLWRNPWDQWWSYKTTNGFDYQNRQIINAPNTLRSIISLRSYLSFQIIYDHTVHHIQDGGMKSDESYLTYYLLWCLGLHEGIKNAHLLINIDKLTESDAYREEIQRKLAENSIHQIDFSDCQIPQGHYYEEDEKFFLPLEDKVHEWLRDDLSIEQVESIQELRKQYRPQIQSSKNKDEQLKSMAKQTTQIRTVSRRLETDKALYLQKYLTIGRDLETRIEQEKKNNDEASKVLAAVYNSRSWRLTQPLRWVGHQIRLARLQGPWSHFIASVKKLLHR